MFGNKRGVIVFSDYFGDFGETWVYIYIWAK
jgi:hypothetical protein